MKTKIVVDGLSIIKCREKIIDFVRHDAYQKYDRDGVRAELRPDVISSDQLTLMNSAMMARSSRKAWAPFLDRRLPELGRVPLSVDLVDDPEDRVDDALARLRDTIQILCVPWITDMAATKLLFLKRPKLVAISDEYVRRRLRIQGPPGPDRALAVARSVRKIGRNNLRALQRLQDYSATINDPAGEPVTLSKARLLDILLWIEEALPAGRHRFWSGRYPLAQ